MGRSVSSVEKELFLHYMQLLESGRWWLVDEEGHGNHRSEKPPRAGRTRLGWPSAPEESPVPTCVLQPRRPCLHRLRHLTAFIVGEIWNARRIKCGFVSSSNNDSVDV